MPMGTQIIFVLFPSFLRSVRGMKIHVLRKLFPRKKIEHQMMRDFPNIHDAIPLQTQPPFVYSYFQVDMFHT